MRPLHPCFTDYHNSLFAFSPVSMEPSLRRHKVPKVIRWALFLSAFNYRIEHVPGDSNILPDIMTRWTRGYRRSPSIRRVTAALPFNGVAIPPDSLEFDWPSAAELVAAQSIQKASAPCKAKPLHSGLLVTKGAVWILEDCVDLKLRLLTIAHAGNSEHRGSYATWNALREAFTWTDLRDDTRSFI